MILQRISNWTHLCLLVLLVYSLSSCSSSEVRRQLRTPDKFLELDLKADYMKVHFRDGKLAIISNWKTYDDKKLIIGTGTLYTSSREIINVGIDTIPFDKIALLETNTIRPGAGLAGLSILTGGTLVIAIYCAINPKACFGSCPTFYAWDGKHYSLIAEGFSSSILPSLEASDIDALYSAVPTSSTFELRMTNEALETHLVKYADLLIAKRPPNGRIVHMIDNTLREGLSFFSPSECLGPEGSILPLIASFDTIERYSLSDSNDLNDKETINLKFDKHDGLQKGLTLGFRQSLLTTFLFYQGLAYLGDSATRFLAMIESHPELKKSLGDPFSGHLGGIDVSVQGQNGSWHSIGEFYEAGPIGHNIQTMAIPDSVGDCTNIRLRMTKGMWRINYASLVTLGKSVQPTRLHPFDVSTDTGKCPTVLALLQSGEGHVVSMPGDKWVLKYHLPENYWNYELLLDSKGYYLEWMRKEWLAETNPGKAALMFAFPSLFLKQEAPLFKKLEPSMENSFWTSRYVRH